MGQVLAYRLHGPTASWGTVEAGVERRPSTRDPGRGAVLGILAAALGFRRDETKRHAGLSDGVLIAVCGHGERRLVQEVAMLLTPGTGGGGEVAAVVEPAAITASTSRPP
jgi:CRISPR system Cascade subunit CasD